MEQVNENTCVRFAFSFSQHLHDGKSVIESLVSAGNDFKKEIRSIHTNNRKEGAIKTYFFTDYTACTYNMGSGYFTFRSPKKQTICSTQIELTQ